MGARPPINFMEAKNYTLRTWWWRLASDWELVCWLWHCAAAAVALKNHERANAFNLVLCFIACFILLVIAPLMLRELDQWVMEVSEWTTAESDCTSSSRTSVRWGLTSCRRTGPVAAGCRPTHCSAADISTTRLHTCVWTARMSSMMCESQSHIAFTDLSCLAVKNRWVDVVHMSRRGPTLFFLLIQGGPKHLAPFFLYALTLPSINRF